MKLYGLQGACSLVDHIALEWSGLEYSFELLNRTQIKEPDFLKVNPLGSVPALVDGDNLVTQNVAILYYITAKATNSRLVGGDDLNVRTQVMRWLSYFNSDVHPSFKPLFGGFSYLGQEGEKLAKEQAVIRLKTLYGLANEQLNGKNWLAGTDNPTIADAYCYVTLRWIKSLGVDLGQMSNLESFYQRFEADQAVQKALKAEGL